MPTDRSPDALPEDDVAADDDLPPDQDCACGRRTGHQVVGVSRPDIMQIVGQCIQSNVFQEVLTSLRGALDEFRDKPRVVQVTPAEGGYVVTVEARVPIEAYQQEMVDLLLGHATALLAPPGRRRSARKAATTALVEDMIALLRKHQQDGKLLTRKTTRVRVVTNAADLPKAIEDLLQ